VQVYVLIRLQHSSSAKVGAVAADFVLDAGWDRILLVVDAVVIGVSWSALGQKRTCSGSGARPLRARNRYWPTTQGLASRTILNGVSAARRMVENPAWSIIISRNRFSPACAPSAGPFWASETGTQTSDDAP
jgi:hypothetical protein